MSYFILKHRDLYFSMLNIYILGLYAEPRWNWHSKAQLPKDESCWWQLCGSEHYTSYDITSSRCERSKEARECDEAAIIYLE